MNQFMETLLQALRRFVDWWLPPLPEDADRFARFRARLLVVTMLSADFILVFAGVVCVLWVRTEIVTWVAFPVGFVLFTSLLFFYRKTGRHELAAHVFIATAVAIITGAIVFTGGYFSAAMVVLVIAPGLALLASGRRAAIGWSVVVIALHVGMLQLEFAGYVFPQYMNPPDHELSRTMIWLIVLLVNVTALIVYDSFSERLSVELADERDRMAYRAGHDPLTNLANRGRFDETLEIAMRRADRSVRSLAFLLLDLDQFKPVNDEYGHQAGDQVLVEIAQRLVNSVRSSDLVARIGGDEFAVILEGLHGRRDAELVASNLSEKISQPYSVNDESVSVGISIGIALYPEQSQNASDLLRYADAAMYRAKAEKAPFRVYSEEFSLRDAY